MMVFSQERAGVGTPVSVPVALLAAGVCAGCPASRQCPRRLPCWPSAPAPVVPPATSILTLG